MTLSNAPIDKRQGVVTLQSLTGVVLYLLIVVPGQASPLWVYALLLVFTCFFLFGWILPEWVFYHHLFDVSILTLNGAFFAFGVTLNPSLPWEALLLYYFLFYVVSILGDKAVRWKLACALLLVLYFELLTWHGHDIFKEGLGLLIGFPFFLALAVLYAYLIERAGQERDKAEEKERIRTEVIVTLAHDIKQPVTAIMGYTELLSSTMNGAPASEAVERIRHNSELIIDLVSGFLDAAKVEAAADGERTEVHIERLLSPPCDDFSLSCVRKDIDFSVHFSDLPPVMGNESQLERVFRNLISNAVKFTPEGGKVMVRASLEGDEVKVAVQDTGEGIANEDLSVIFTSFKRVGKKESDGTGLGLFIVKTIVEAHGGHVTVDSELGQGSLFTVYLPALQIRALTKEFDATQQLSMSFER
jgi:signal transduction histidine kinase